MSLQAFDTMLAFAAAMLILSLLVTAWVQFLSALLRLRSGNLEWGLQRLLEQIDPNDQLKQHRSQLVQQVLEHPALARDSTWFGTKAEAIKAEELVKTLRQLATAPNPGAIGAAVGSWVSSLSPAQAPAQLQAQIDAITEEAGKLFPQQTQALRDAVERAIHSRDDLAQRVALWFDSAMDRTSERFALQCRWLTVAGAGVVVLVMGVDAQWMLRQLNDKPEFREPLVAYVQEVQQKEEAETAKACDQLAGKNNPAATAAAAAPTADESAKACVELRRQQLAAAQKRLDQGVTALLRPEWWRADGADAAAVKTASSPYAGMLFSFVLLSLGAPFWFNVLKNLSSLRPLIASRSDSKSA